MNSKIVQTQRRRWLHIAQSRSHYRPVEQTINCHPANKVNEIQTTHLRRVKAHDQRVGWIKTHLTGFRGSTKLMNFISVDFYSKVNWRSVVRIRECGCCAHTCSLQLALDPLFGFRAKTKYQISHFKVFAGIRTPKKTLFWPLMELGLSLNPFLKI